MEKILKQEMKSQNSAVETRLGRSMQYHFLQYSSLHYNIRSDYVLHYFAQVISENVLSVRKISAISVFPRW